MFGLLGISDHFEPLNHVILIAKQTIFYCRRKNIVPSLNIFLAQLKNVIKIEEFLAKQKNKLHLEKWKNFKVFIKKFLFAFAVFVDFL